MAYCSQIIVTWSTLPFSGPYQTPSLCLPTYPPSPFFLAPSVTLATLPSQFPATSSAGTGHKDTIKAPSLKAKGPVTCRPGTLSTHLPLASVAPHGNLKGGFRGS